MGVDDMVRAICARGEVPTSLALVRHGIVEMNGEPYRALVTTGEAAGRRHLRALVMQMAPDGKVVGLLVYNEDGGEVGDDGWIGVPPITDMTLFTLDSGEA